jgi:hypothetical protein
MEENQRANDRVVLMLSQLKPVVKLTVQPYHLDAARSGDGVPADAPNTSFEWNGTSVALRIWFPIVTSTEAITAER